MDELDTLYDANEFIFPGRLWFVAPKSALGELGRFADAIYRVETESGVYMVAFTDSDLAKSFAEAQGPEGSRPSRFAFPTMSELYGFIKSLQAKGETHLAFDPGVKNVRVISLDRVVAGIERSGKA